MAIELGFRNGGDLSEVEKSPHHEKAFLLKQGKGKYRFGEDEIEFGLGQADHEWTAIRGALPKPDADCVYITGFTPFKKKIQIG